MGPATAHAMENPHTGAGDAAAPTAGAPPPPPPQQPSPHPPPGLLAARRQALRLHLQVLTERLPSHLQAASVQRLAAAHPGAQVRALPGDGLPAQPLYNCVMHALDLAGRFEPPLQHLQGLDFRYLADTALLRQALALGVIHHELSLAEARAGDLVVYFSRGPHSPHSPRSPAGQGSLPCHVGKYQGGGLCVSKWGPGGLYEHGLWDLPLPLGDSARFFRPPEAQRVLALLRRREPGLRLAPGAPAPKRRAPPYTAVFAGHAPIAPANRRDAPTTA